MDWYIMSYHKFWLAFIRRDKKVIKEFIIHFNLAKTYLYFWGFVT